MYYRIEQKLTMSLLKKVSSIDEKTSKTEYKKLCTAKFNYDPLLFEGETDEKMKKLFSDVLNSMFEDLTERDVDYESTSIGLWIEVAGEMFENSIDISTLNTIRQIGNKDDLILEFYKMTIRIDDEEV